MASLSQSAYLELVGDYKPGSIRKIKLKNFLTYSDVEITPGPRLNMVVGPNGTGKSSILCAICLALGGEPKLLGRADDARTYIMNGKDKASLEIELVPYAHDLATEEDDEFGPPPHVLGRIIDREKGTESGKGRGASTYYINNNRVTINNIKKLVKEKYHISIDNLCTFLPQDKVGKFSEFDDKSLLIETEKTLSGSRHLYNTHMNLIAAEEEMRGGLNDVSTIQSKLDKLVQENQRLEREKERMEERQEAIEHAELLEKKILWLKFEVLREEVINLQAEKKERKKQLKDAQQILLPLQSKLQKCQTEKDIADDKYRTMENNTKRYAKEMEKQQKKYENHDDSIDGILLELREIDTRRKNNLNILHKATERVELLESEAEAFPSQTQVDEEFNAAVQQRKKIIAEYKKAKQEFDIVRNKLKEKQDHANMLQNKLVKMADDKARRNERIFQQQPNLSKIHKWLEQNRKIFRRKVWGPVVCEVTTKSQNSAAYLEQHVPKYVLKSFIVECKEDYDRLYNEVRMKLKVPINVIMVKDGALEPLQERIYSDEKMRILKQEHGVVGYLDEAFTAPDAIVQALRSSAQIHKVLVGGESTRKSIAEKNLLDYLSEPDRNLRQNGYQASCIFASEKNQSSKYTTIISRHGAKLPSNRIDYNIPQAKWLAPGVNPRVKEQLEQDLTKAHEEISEYCPHVDDVGRKIQELELEAQNAQKEAETAKAAKEELAKFLSKLTGARRKKKEAEDIVNGANNDEKEKKDLILQVMNRTAATVSALESHAEFHEKMLESTYSSAGLKIKKDVCILAEKKIHRDLVEKQHEFEEIKRENDRVTEAYKARRNVLEAIKNEAESKARLVDPETGEELPIKGELEALPVDTLDEAEAALEEANAKANSIIANPDVIKQYESRKAEIEKIEAQLNELKGNKSSKELEIEQMKRPWEESLKNSIEKINGLFSRYMAELDCTGEIALKLGNDEKGWNFRDWGIEIRVSFRKNTKTQVLSARVQSGGERSVSTIMYLMALQEMMVSPFRCVDEINQGLDDRNERLVFRRIVENSTRKPKNSLTDHSGQYFLITPKLLPNLYDMENEAVTVLFVFNGPFNCLPTAGWDVDQLVSMRKKRALQQATSGDVDNENNNGDENSPMDANSNTHKKPIAKKSRKSSGRKSRSA